MMTRGRGGVTIPPKIDDVIYEQPLTPVARTHTHPRLVYRPPPQIGLNAKPWLFSVWQKSRHSVAKLVLLTAVIFEYF